MMDDGVVVELAVFVLMIRVWWKKKEDEEADRRGGIFRPHLLLCLFFIFIFSIISLVLATAIVANLVVA